MGTPNTALQDWLLRQNPKMTKEATVSVIKDMENSFITALQSQGFEPAELLKMAQEQPDQWNNLVNNYVAETVVAAQQAKVAEAQAKQAEQEKLAAAAEAVHLGQVMAHSFLEELHKIAEASDDKGGGMPPALREAMDKEDKDKDKDKSEPDKDNGVNREPDHKEPDADNKKESSALPAKVRWLKLAIEKKAEANLPVTKEEDNFIALCKLAEAGHTVDFSGVQ